VGTYAEDAPVCICTDLGASSAHSLHSHGVGGGNIVSARYLGYAGQYNEVVIAVESKNFFLE